MDHYYSGEWKNHTRHGKGVDSSSSGGLYIGQYKEGNRDGEGTFYENDYSVIPSSVILKYKGGWKVDKREGIGSDYEGGKLVYEGEFKYDKRNGTGVFIKADGTKQKALWLDGVNKEVDPASAPKPEFVLTGIDDSFDGGNINKWDMYSGGLRAEMKSSVLKITSLQSGSGFIRKELPGKLSFDKKDDWAFEVNATKTVGDNFASWSIGWYNGDLLVNNQGIVLFVFPKDQHIQTKLIH